MQFKSIHKSYFFITLVCWGSVCTGQSFFNRLTGTNPYQASARSLAMGKTSFSEKTTSLLLINPAGMGRISDEISFFYQLNGISTLERRGFDVKDFFGDYLTTSDYVVNHNKLIGSGLGIAGNKIRGPLKFTAAFSVNPLTSFGYKYVEEIRGKMSFDDGIIGNKDPLLGYHHFEVRGQLERYSFGVGLQYQLDEWFELNWGVAIHKVPSSSIHDIFKVDTLQSIDGYLAGVQSLDEVTNTSQGQFASFGFELNTWKGVSISVALDTELQIESDSFSTLSANYPSGLPEFFNQESNTYMLNGINYIKPSRLSLGLAYSILGKNPVLVCVDFRTISGYKFNENSGSSLQMMESNSWHFGFEYITLSLIPVRVGMIYKQSPFQTLDPTSTITVGSGFNIEKLKIDFATGFQSMEYGYPDLFPVDGDVRPDLDRVKESSFHFNISLSYTI